MSWDNAFAAERDAAARGPLAANPATFGEIWKSSWDAAGLDTAFGVGAPWAEAHRELRDQVETVSGQSLSALAQSQGKRLRADGYAGATLQDQSRELADLAAGLTPEQQEKIKPYLDVPARARAKAAETERQAADIADRTYGLSGHAVGFLAGAARQGLDPVNLGTMFVGGPARGPVLKMLAREFGLGASVQALQEPAIEAGRADLGLEAGFGRALANVLEAGIGNAGLAGLFRAGSWLMRRAVEPRDVIGARPAAESPAVSESPRVHAPAPEPVAARAVDVPAMAEAVPARAEGAAMPAALREIAPEDLDAAARIVERDQLVDSLSPDPSSAAKAVHAEAIDEMTTRMEASSREIISGFDRKLEELETRLRGDADAQRETAGEAGVSPPAQAPARRRPDRPQRPVSLARFIAMNGGIRLDADARSAGFDKAFVPGVGPVARRTGRAIDQLEPLLIEEGYLPPQPVDAPSRDITAELYEALDAEFRHKRPTYRQRDQAAAAERGASADADIDQRWRDEIAAEADNIRARMAEAGHDLSAHADDIDAAAELIVRGVESDWGDALERVAIMRELGDDAAVPAVREILDDIPGWELDDAVSARETSSDRGAAGSGGEGAARPADRRGSARAGEDVPQPGQDGARAGGREGDAPLAALGRLAAATDDPAAFKARLADLDRAMAAAGGDLTVHLDGGDVSLRAELDAIRADADAADALKACLGQGGGA